MLGDGAPWIWNLATKHFATATQIVDLYHAREHVHALSALVAPAPGERAHGWFTDRLTELDRGDITALVPPAPSPSPTRRPTRWIRRSATSRPTPTGCVTRTSASSATSSDPAPSKPAAKPPSANASNNPGCAGTPTEPPA